MDRENRGTEKTEDGTNCFAAAELPAIIIRRTDSRIDVCGGKTTASTLTGSRSLTGNVCECLWLADNRHEAARCCISFQFSFLHFVRQMLTSYVADSPLVLQKIDTAGRFFSFSVVPGLQQCVTAIYMALKT